jgi:hypothetical protein
LDLKVSEECVGAEEGEDLVEDIVALAVGVGRLVGRQRRRGVGEGVGRASGLGTEREEREVADYAGDVGIIVENGVVCLESVVSLVDIVRCGDAIGDGGVCLYSYL